MDKGGAKTAATPELPRCDKPLGTAAVQESQSKPWVRMGLSSPEVLLKLFASRSNCLRMVDRNGGLAMHNQEERIAQSGDLRRDSNIGRGQVAAADYFIVPDIANSNTQSNNGVNAAGAVASVVASRFIPLPGIGSLAGSLRSSTSQAQALITLVNARTTEQLYVAEGAAQKTDVSLGGGSSGPGGFAAAAGGAYANTPAGKVVTAAYFNAFIDLVRYMQSNAAPTAGSASANSPIQAYKAIKVTELRVTASPQAKSVRSFTVGELVYPTGQKDGIWWQADDENGNRGWVTSTSISPR
jgi:hypothetical protein